MDFTVPVNHEVKMKQSEKIYKCLDLVRELKKALDDKGIGDSNNSWRVRYSSHRLSKCTGRTGNERRSCDHTDHKIVDIS